MASSCEYILHLPEAFRVVGGGCGSSLRLPEALSLTSMSRSRSCVGVSIGALEAITSRTAVPQRSASAWRGEQRRTLCFLPDTVTVHSPRSEKRGGGRQSGPAEHPPLPSRAREEREVARGGLTSFLGPALRAVHRTQAGQHQAPEAPRPLPVATELVQ